MKTTTAAGAPGRNMASVDGQRIWLGEHGVLLIGYDVEVGGQNGPKPEGTDKFLPVMAAVHRELKAPCTLFICGVTLEKYSPTFRPLLGDPLLEFAQHTYAHLLVKSCVERGREGKFFCQPHASLDELRVDIPHAQEVLAAFTGTRPIGFCSPWGCACGLLDRWDLVELLSKAGLQYCRTYNRRADGSDLYDLRVDPFWYSAQGFPEFLEIPMGEPCDVHVRPSVYRTAEAYSKRLDDVLEQTARHNYVFNYGAHDHSALVDDPEMTCIRRMINRARALGIEILTHGEYYRRCCAVRKVTSN